MCRFRNQASCKIRQVVGWRSTKHGLIQGIFSQAIAVQGIGILKNPIEQDAVFKASERGFSKAVLLVMIRHDLINALIINKRVGPAELFIVVGRPLPMSHIQPVILTAGVVKNCRSPCDTRLSLVSSVIRDGHM